MDSSQLLFSPAINWFVLGSVGLAVFIYLFLSYRSIRAAVGAKTAMGLAAFKLLLVVLLVMCLVQPVASMERRLKGQGAVAVLLDTSGSMAVEDSLAGKARIEAALDLLVRDTALLKALAEDFSIATFRFDESLRTVPLTQYTDVTSDLRQQTAILGSLSELSSMPEAKRLAAVVMITDGRENAAAADWSVVRDLGVPVFTVGVGTDFTTDENMTNLAILSVDSPNVAYVNNSVSMTVSVGAFNVPERRKFARLRLLSGDEEIDAKNFRMPESGTVERVSMDFTPSSTGFNKYKLKLDTLSEESILRDNERDVYIDVREPRLRVLYIEGVLRSEYGFIRRTLETDPDVRITSLVRTRKDSFLLQGAKAEADLSRGLPDKEEDFESFDVVLLGDVPAATFREYQVKNLVKWVDEGHGLMMTGGHNAFYHGGWHETELARALPVRMSSRDAQVSDPLIVQLTPAGLNHPIFKGLDFSSAAMRDGKGALGGCSEPDGVKSGASVLAHGKTARGKKHILCAVHKFGSGRVAVFTGDTTGKANRELVGLGYKSPYPDFWSQMIRWLAGFDDMRKEKDVYLKLAMESRFVKAGSTVEIRSEVSDNKGKLTSTPSVELTVESPAGETSELSHSIDHKSLTGSASFAVSKVGLHKVSGVMTDAGGTELDRTEYYFLAGQPWLENSNLSLDEPSLKRLARETCGRYYNVVSAAQIPQDIARSRGKGVERVTVSLWNNPFVFLALLALLAIEWFVRRRKQLL